MKSIEVKVSERAARRVAWGLLASAALVAAAVLAAPVLAAGGGGGGGAFQGGTVPNATTFSSTVQVTGASTLVGALNLFAADATGAQLSRTGAQTVQLTDSTGLIGGGLQLNSISFIPNAASNAQGYISFGNGTGIGTSGSNAARIRYNNTSGFLETSLQNAAYVGIPTSPFIASINTGRLSLSNHVYCTTADVTAATTLYWVPEGEDQTNGTLGVISTYDSSVWTPHASAQVSVTLVGLTASKAYDIWGRNVSGTFTLDSTVWTNDTTRATALAAQDGILTKNGDASRRYLGTIYVDAGGGAVTDSAASRNLWNYSNPKPRQLYCADLTTSWVYSTAAFREANASGVLGTSRFSWISGLDRDSMRIINTSTASAGVAGEVEASIGIDSTTTSPTNRMGGGFYAPVAGVGGCDCSVTYNGLGYHYAARLENGSGATTVTWYGKNASNESNRTTGMSAIILN